MNLILARHAETYRNVQGLIYGNLSSKLTENGKKQAEELAVMLGSYKIDEIFCSDLDRCIETAEPIITLNPGVPITYNRLLREQSQGSLIGRKVKEVDWHKLPPDVETPALMATRSEKFLSDLELIQRRTILIISHRRFLNTFVNVLLGKPRMITIQDTFLATPQSQ